MYCKIAATHASIYYHRKVYYRQFSCWSANKISEKLWFIWDMPQGGWENMLQRLYAITLPKVLWLFTHTVKILSHQVQRCLSFTNSAVHICSESGILNIFNKEENCVYIYSIFISPKPNNLIIQNWLHGVRQYDDREIKFFICSPIETFQNALDEKHARKNAWKGK